MAEPNIVVSLIDVLADGEPFDDVAHHLKALAKVASLVKADTHFERRFGALVVVFVVFARDGLELHPSFVVGAITFEKEIAEPHIGFVADLAARIALDDRLPNLDRFAGLFGFEPSIAGFHQLASRPVFDDRSLRPGRSFALRLRLLCDHQSERKTDESAATHERESFHEAGPLKVAGEARRDKQTFVGRKLRLRPARVNQPSAIRRQLRFP